jgi:uncharacterized protein
MSQLPLASRAIGGSGFQLSLRQLRRTQGALKQFVIDQPLGAAVVAGLVELPPERVIHLAGSLESAGDGVWLRAVAEVELDAQCARCLSAFTYPCQVEVEELFVYPEQAERYQDLDAPLIHDDQIDLADPVRDAIILDQPLSPLCREDCRGLCPQCGADLNAETDHDHPDSIDARWIGLRSWGKMS